MIQYIYFVKCPDCEDEQFDFFDEAKTYALGCLSAKPIITQVEVDRDDFGCCTDSCDLGTIWSYEDALGNDCGSEDDNRPSTFTKSETFGISDEDFSKEFEDNEISKVLNDLIKDEYEAIDGYESAENLIKQYDLTSEDKDNLLSTLDHIKAEEEEHVDELKELSHKNTKSDAMSNFCCKESKVPFKAHKPLIETKRDSFQEAIFEAIDYLTEFNDIFPVPDNIGIVDWNDFKDNIRYGLSSDFEIAEILMEYLDRDLAISRRHPEIFEDDPQSELTLEIYNKLKRAYDRAITQYKAEHAEDFEESCERKPIPDGMTLKELVEEMEENEDTVECSWCKDLFDKSECRYEVNLGWLCDRCQAAIMSRGEPLTFRENNYWDFLDEEDKDISAGDRVWTCVFDDQEIGTVTAKTKEEAEEKMQHEYPDYPYSLYDGCFEVYLKEDMKKLTEEYADEVELEYFGFEDDYGPDSYTYRVDRNKVIEYIIDYEIEHLSDEEIKTLLKLTKAPEEYSEEEYFQAIEENFDEVFKKFEGDIYDYFREDCEEEYYSQDWERIAYEQAMEFQWECDNDK